MRVLIVSQHFWPELIRINDVAQTLSECGATVTVLTGQPNYPLGTVFDGYRAFDSGREKWGNVEIVRVPLIPRGNGSAFRLTLNYLSFISCGIVLGPILLRKKSFDVVFVFGSSPLLQALVAVPISWIKKCPLVTWVQDLWPESLQSTGYVQSNLVISAVGRLVGWIYSKTRLILVQSPEFISSVERRSGKTPIDVHYNPAESAQLVRSGLGDRPKIVPGLGNQFDVVFAGNLGTAQSLETVIDAATILQDDQEIRFFIVGTGSRAEWLTQQILVRGIRNIILTGQVDPVHMPAIYSDASVLLGTLRDHPNYNLTIPSKVQAYLAAGRPIILCMNGASASIVATARAGICCGADNAIELAEAIRTMKTLPEGERIAMGENGRAFYETHFEPKALGYKLLNHLQHALDLSRGTP